MNRTGVQKLLVEAAGYGCVKLVRLLLEHDAAPGIRGPEGATPLQAAGKRGGDSAHLIHRNHGNQDGALVLAASSSAPSWLLFHFAEQSF